MSFSVTAAMFCVVGVVQLLLEFRGGTWLIDGFLTHLGVNEG